MLRDSALLSGASPGRVPLSQERSSPLDNGKPSNDRFLSALKRWQEVPVFDVQDAVAICEAVGSPSVKVLFDVYQCQCESGDLTDNIDAYWDQIGCIQIADNPGRSEPGTGEIKCACAHQAARLGRTCRNGAQPRQAQRSR